MGAQEVAAVVSILVATPAAALYSIARWDASRYLLAPETKNDIEEDRTEKKPTRLQKCLRSVCLLAFMGACWGAGWSLQYLPAVLRDSGMLFLMCGFPVFSSTYGGAVLFGTAHEVFSIKEIEGKTVLQADKVQRAHLQRTLTASVGALALSCTYFRAGYTTIMTLIGIGMLFSSSLLMGLETTKASPPLRTSAKWYSIIFGTVVAVAYAIPPLIDWLSAKFNQSKKTPVRAKSPITAWTDNATQIYAIVCVAMWGSITCGVLLSRLYRIDVANARRKNITNALDPAVRPKYLLDATGKGLSGSESQSSSDASAHSIRIMSPLEMYTSGALRDLIFVPWYSGSAYACMAIMLIFAMPTLLSIFPTMNVIKNEAIQAGADWDNSTWLSSSVCVAIYASTYLGLLPMPMLLVVAALALVRGESGFVWKETFDWNPFASPNQAESFSAEK